MELLLTVTPMAIAKTMKAAIMNPVERRRTKSGPTADLKYPKMTNTELDKIFKRK